jgi:hypothetical protein
VERPPPRRATACRPTAARRREFGLAYFGESERRSRLAARVVEIVQRKIDVSLDGVHPDDSLTQDLMMGELDSLAAVEIVAQMPRRSTPCATSWSTWIGACRQAIEAVRSIGRRGLW